MAYTTITATTIGIADGDTSPSPVDGTVRITPRFPSAATASGFTISGPVVVEVTGGEMPKTEIPSMTEATGLVEFHLYDRNAGPVKMPATEIPLDPDTTISLNEYLPVGVDPVSGAAFIKGETGPQGPRGERGPEGPEGPKGATGDRGPEGPEGPRGPQGETGDRGPEGPQGPQGEPGVDGTDGADGEDGTGIEVKDTLTSVDDLPETGEVGDAYLINRNLYVWSASTNDWANAGTLQGPQGEQGPKGDPGTDGEDGSPGQDGAAGADGTDGQDGASAYEVAVAAGFEGTSGEWLETLVGPQGPEGPEGKDGADGTDGTDGEQGPKGEPGEDGEDAPRADLIANLEAPVVIAHRGGGALVYPEQGLRGMIAAAEDGFLPEFDIQFLGDGTPVLCHDNTVDRTMTGATGLVKDLSITQWKQLRVNPVFEGGRDDRPVTFEEVLDYLGGRVVLVAEVKQGATASEVERVVGHVKERSLEKSVLMQSFDFDSAKAMAAAGLEVVFLCGQTVDRSWSEVKNEGINYLGPSRMMSESDMNDAASAGLRVMPYVTKRRSHAASLPSSVFGYFSDDPWASSDRMPQWSTPGWSTGDGWPGRIVQSPSDGVIVDYPAQLSGGNLALPEYRGADGTSTYYLIHVGLTHMTGGPIEAPFRMYGKFLYGRGHSSQTSNCGFTLFRNDIDPDAPFKDGAVDGQQGFTFAARRNGEMQGWAYVDGSSASTIMRSYYSGDGDPVPQGQSRIIEVLLEVDDSGMIRWTNLTTGVTAEADGATVGGSWTPMIRAATQGVTVLDVAVWRSPTPLPPISE